MWNWIKYELLGLPKPKDELEEILPDGTLNPFWVEKQDFKKDWVVSKKHKVRLYSKDHKGDLKCKHKIWAHSDWYKCIEIKTGKLLGLFYCKNCGRAENKEMDKMKVI